jgi:phthalate 4,5-dioxygenase
MRAEQNELVTRIGPGTACGAVLRQYWHPVALVEEFDPAVDPAMHLRPLKTVRVLGEDLVLFKNADGTWGLLERACPHRGADLSFGRLEPREEGGGLRCPFHGWKFAPDGQCLDTPAEPAGSKLYERVRHTSYPVIERNGLLMAWLGPQDATPPPLPNLDCFRAPASHSFAFKGLWNANWLQAFEVGIDPAHTSYLHRFLNDEDLGAIGANAAGKQFRSPSAGDVEGERWPMTRIMREFGKPDIRVDPTAWGFRLKTLRQISDARTHVRVTNGLFPATFLIPLSETVTITQYHLPVDDTHTYWFSIFTSFDQPLDARSMREQRMKFITLPDYAPKSGAHNRWGFNPQEQRSLTYLGMGEDDINVHDQWAVESMGPIQDRTRERLGTTDKVIMANRRLLLQAIDDVRAGKPAPGFAQPDVARQVAGPDTVDGIAPLATWEAWWLDSAQRKREQARWLEGPAPQESDPPA